MAEAVAAPLELLSKGLLRKLIPITAFGAVAYGALLLYGDAGAISRNMARVPTGLLLASAGLALASYAVRGARWVYYLRVSKIRVPVLGALLVTVAGFAMSITPAKMGEVLKSLLLKQAWDVPIARSAPLVVAERVTDLAGLLILGGVGLLAVPEAEFATAFVFAGAVALFVLSTNRAAGLAAIRFLTRLRSLVKYREKITIAYLSLHEVLKPGPFAVGLLFSLVTWGMQCLCVSLLVRAFGQEISLPIALVSYSAPLLAGTLALIPGGLGLTEASMTGALETLGSLDADVAASVTILVRLVTFWFAIALGFVALAIWRPLPRSSPTVRAKP